MFDSVAQQSYGTPFVVAVTGHRNLEPEDIAQVGDEVFHVIELVAAALPHTPIHFLSSLADGADQLFAEQVLCLQQQVKTSMTGDADRLRLIVPLPMPLDTYCFEQAGGESAKANDGPAFEAAKTAFAGRVARFAAAADSMFVIPQVAPEGASVVPVAHEGEAYARLAHYLRSHAHLLIVIWDGQTAPADQFPRLPGGTLDTVMSLLQGGADRLRNDSAADRLAELKIGKIIHVYSRRTLPSSAGLPSARERGGGFHVTVGPIDPASGQAVIEYIMEPEASWPGVKPPALKQWMVSPRQAWGSFAKHRAWRHMIATTEGRLGRNLDAAELVVLYRLVATGEIDAINAIGQESVS